MEFDDRLIRLGPVLGRQKTRQRLIEASCSGLIEAIKEVPVPVERYLDRGMPEAGLDDLGMLTLGNQRGDMRVAQVVKPHRLTYRGPHRRQEDASSEIASPKQSAPG